MPGDRGSPIRVLTVDDQAVFRAAVRDVIDATPGFAAVGEAASGAEALALLDSLRPDLVLVDVRMPDMDGIETTRRLKAVDPSAVVVLVSLENLDDVAPRAGSAVTFVRKQDLCSATLRSVWTTHGRVHPI